MLSDTHEVPTAAAIVAEGHRVVGVDVSPRQIDLARTNVPRSTFLVADAMKIGFEPAAFDAVVALYSITHIRRDRYETLFGRLLEWLRPGGWLLASFGTTDESGWDEENFLGLGHSNWTNGFDAAMTQRLLSDAGFALAMSEIVDDKTPFGRERWLWVLAHREPNL